MDEIEKSEEENRYRKIFPIAAAMIYSDRGFISSAYLLLVAVPLLTIGSATTLPQLVPVILFFERIIQLSFLLVVTKRWINTFRTTQMPFSLISTVRFYLFGMILWLLFMVPIFFGLATNNEVIASFSLCIICIATFFSIRYFCYPVPLLLGTHSLEEGLHIAHSIVGQNRLLAFRLIAAPLGIMSTLVALTLAPYPDGRVPFFTYLAQFAGASFWVLFVYLCLAASFVRLDNSWWQRFSLDPYRSARFSTLEKQAGSWLSRQLRPSQGLAWLGVSILIWFANFIRLYTTAPAAQIAVENVSVNGSILTITASLNDHEYKFRGFHPLHFGLGGDQYPNMVYSPEQAINLQSGADVRFGLPEDVSNAKIKLQFKTPRKGAELTALTDLHLGTAQQKYLDWI